MNSAAVLGLLVLIVGAIILASAIQVSFSTVSGVIAIERIDWPNVIAGFILSLSGSALINVATAKTARTRKRRK